MRFEKYILTFSFASCNIVMYKNLRIYALARMYMRIAPKPEVEIMMRNNKKLKGFLLNATKLLVLALVFVTAFAVALTSDFVGSIDGNDVVNVADATTADKGGSTPAKISGFNAAAFNFPDGNTNKKSWSAQVSLSNLSITTANVSVYKPEDTNVDVNISVSGNQYSVQADGRATKYIQVTSRINLDLGDFVNTAIQVGYTVKVTIDASVSYEGGSNKQSGALSLAILGKASSGEARDAYASTVTLTRAKPYLAFETYSTAQNQTVFTDPIKHTVVLNSVKVEISVNDNMVDGAAPIASSKYVGLQNGYVKGTSGSGYAPYVTDTNTASNFPVYFDSIKKYLKTDKVADGTGTLASYTNKAIDKFNGKNYYKFAQTEYVDMFNRTDKTFDELIEDYLADPDAFDKTLLSKVGAGDKTLSVSGSNIGWNNASNDHYINASGIKSVQVGDVVFDIYNSSGGSNGTQTKEITVSDTDGNTVSVGYATVTRTNRARVVVSIYFTTNATVQTVVSDFSGYSVTTRLEVTGIDTSLNDNGTPISDNDYMKADASSLAWLYSNLLEVGSEFEIPEDTSAANYSPRLWFFTAQRADELASLGSAHVFASVADLLASGLKPIGVGEGFTFDYNFADGKAKSYGSSIYDAIGTLGSDGKVTSESGAKGHGYYLFTFYTIDLAGNMSATSSSYYVKVDYDTPNYNVDLSYILKTDGSKQTISAAQNGTWAKGVTTLDILLGSLGFSGNTLIFEDTMSYHVFKFENAMVDGVYTSRLASYYNSLTTTSAIAVENDEIEITLSGEGGNHTVTVKYIFEASTNSGILRFVVNANSIEWTTVFTLYTGGFDTVDEMDFHQGHSYVDSTWVGGVKVLIDTDNPIAPEFVSGEENPFSKPFVNYDSLPQYGERQWYTGAYDKYSASIAFNDVFIGSDYEKDVKVYYGIKLVTNLQELLDLYAKGIEGIYASIKDNSAGYFNRLQIISGDNMTDGDTVLENGAMNIVNGVGMRIIYVWAVDQAGNVSDINTYYLLADNTTYTLNTKVAENSVVDVNAAITAENADQTITDKFTRGEIATLRTMLGDDFVPFFLSLTTNGNKSVLLRNYMPSYEWTLVNENLADYIGYAQSSEMTFAIDNPDNLGMLDNTKTLSVEFGYRKVVSSTVTNSTIAYNSRPIVVEMTFTDALSQSAYQYRYYDKNGNALEQAPVKPGEYFVEIFIAKDNENYVTDDFDMDADGNQKLVRIPIVVTKGKIVISANASTSAYGADLTDVLTFEVSGIDRADMAAEGISDAMLKLALDVQGYVPTGFYNVGHYNIVLADDSLLDGVANYDVTFQTAQHFITQRNVNVYTQSASKVYGDADPTFKFGVKESDLQFNSAKSVSDILAEIFDSAHYVRVGDAAVDGFYLYEAGDRISRVAGEDVWTYDFNIDSTLFDVNNNYKITIQKQGSAFTITQRQVQIDVSGQFSVVKSGVTPSADGIVPSYTLDAKDAFLADVIAKLLRGKLTVDGTAKDLGDYDSAKYDGAKGFAIILASVEDKNIAISLKSAADYVIYISKAGTVIIKANGEFTFVYGFKWTSDAIKYSASNFSYECEEEVDFDDVVWEAVISSASEYVLAGKYVVSFVNAKLMKNGVEIEGRNVNVESALVNVTPASIEVRPTASSLTKVYGDAEQAYGIGFEIVSVNGEALAKDASFAGLTYDELLALVSGSFARAKYSKAGVFYTYGARYDDVLTSDDYYYGYAVNKSFSVNNDNFVVTAKVDEQSAAVRFGILPKDVFVYTAGLVGISKYYNGTVEVVYGDTSMFDLSSQLVLATDDVKLDALFKQYSSAGTMLSDSNVRIKLSSFVLVGKQSANYRLAGIVRDGHSSIRVEGTAVDGVYPIEDTLVEIVYIDNANGVENIKIMFKRIGIKKNDISIVKEYDNTNVLEAENIVIEDSETEIASTAMLRGATKTLVKAESGVFSGVKAGTGYLISRVKIVFTFANTELPDDVIFDYNENDVHIQKSGNTIEVIVINVKATISKKQLSASSFSSLNAKDRDYNSTDIVDVEYVFADDALVSGDTAETVGLRLTGTADGVNVGQHHVKIASEGTKVSNANYEVDVNDINNKYTDLMVSVSKARLMPNVVFGNKVYDNTSDVVWSQKEGNDFTTVNYSDNLKDELSHIKFASSASYVLSDKGAVNGNVMCDALGNEIKHNVMVSGLGVSVVGADASILDNYRLYGAVYNGTDYMYFDNVPTGVIENYEIIEAVNVSKKVIKLWADDFKISNKVYDGTNSATIDIEVPVDGGEREGVLPVHQDSLAISATGTFASAKVGKNIKVSISEVELTVKNGIEYNILNNYELDSSARLYANNIIGNIVEKPVTVNVDLGERIYTGASDIVKSNITYTFDGVIDREVRNYNVATVGGAYFIDKNVVLDEQKTTVLEKDGNVYNPTLTNSKEYNINYVLVYKSDVKESDRSSDDLLAYEDENGMHYYPQGEVTSASAYYYRLRTVSKYVAVEEYENAKDFIVGRYAVNGKEVYLVSDSYTGDAKSLAEPMTYLGGKGKITQRSVYITANSIAKLDTQVADEMYNKAYDGTTKFYGTLQGTNAATDAFRFTESGIANVIKGDQVRIKDVTAEFNSADTNAMYVVFIASGITGPDADNYTISNASGSASSDSYSARLSAKIRKQAIIARLADGEMVYGTALGNVGGNIDYFLHDAAEENKLTWNSQDKAFYVKTSVFMSVSGLDANDAENAKFIAQINANTYNIVDGAYVKADDGTTGEYFKLGGELGNSISTLPVPQVRFNVSKPNAGDVATSYYLSGGNATNFGFVYAYTGNGRDGKSALTVARRTLYITTAGINHTKVYAGTNPAVDLLFDGIVSSDGLNIFVDANGKDYRPVVVLAIYDASTNTYTIADKYAKTSDTLGKDKYYVYYLAMPEGLTSYDKFASTSNYNVVIGTEETLQAIKLTDDSGNVVVDENGKVVYSFNYVFDGGVSKNASTITITLPELKDLSIDTTNNEFVYTYDKAQGDGVNRVYDVLKGAKATDEVKYFNIVNGQIVFKEARDAGVHTGYISVVRKIMVDQNDPNGYTVSWQSTSEVTIKITRAASNLKAATASSYYNGKAQPYPINAVSYHEGLDGLDDDDDYEITYQLYKNGVYEDVSASQVKDAGTYIATIKLTPDFEINHPNYKAETVQAKFIIKKIVYKVTIDGTGYTVSTNNQNESAVTTLSAIYEDGKNYEIDFSEPVIQEGDDSDANIRIEKSDMSVAFTKGANGQDKAIDRAGKYSFSIVITDKDVAKNYTIIGGAGVLELTAKAFASDNGSVSVVDGNGIVANRFVVKEIVGNPESADDVAYASIISKFMPALTKSANLKNEARVAAILKIELYCDNQLVVIDGETTTIRVALPQNVKNLNGIALYTVTRDGTLKKLNDYTLSDGYIEYTTDYVSSLVFVDTNAPALETWQIVTIAVSVSLVVIIVVASVVGVVVRKKKLQKLI